jgi:hypothetical protein
LTSGFISFNKWPTSVKTISNGCRVKLISAARPKVVAQPSSSSLYSKYAENDLPIRSVARSRTSRFEAAHHYFTGLHLLKAGHAMTPAADIF